MLTHWFFPAHNPVQEDNIGVPELRHNGSLLEELHFVLLGTIFVECLQGNPYYLTTFCVPCAFLYTPKLSRPKMTCDSLNYQPIATEIKLMPEIHFFLLN